jgi:spore germination protein YaaH
MKIRPKGVEFFHADTQADRQTDRQKYMTQLRVAFLSFLNASLKPHGIEVSVASVSASLSTSTVQALKVVL